MEKCAICRQLLTHEDTLVYMGYSLCQGDRTMNEDTIIMHSECCEPNLIMLLEEKLLT